jgi:hypothetical protein
MESMQRGERPRAVEAAPEDAGRRLAVAAGMLVFLVGLALFFLATAPR